MKTKIQAVGAAALVAAVLAAASLARENRSLRQALERSENALAEAQKASAAKPGPPEAAAPKRRAPRARPAAKGEDASVAPPPQDSAAFEKAVEERALARADEIERKRREEREARRRGWENATDEEREARRKAFQARMQDHANEKLKEFSGKLGLDDEQSANLEIELDQFNYNVGAIVDKYAALLDGGVKFDFETQMRLMGEVSAAALDAYAGLDNVLPEGWREKGGDFNVMFGLSPSVLDPFFGAMRRAGVRGGGFGPRGPGGFGPMPRP